MSGLRADIGAIATIRFTTEAQRAQRHTEKQQILCSSLVVLCALCASVVKTHAGS